MARIRRYRRGRFRAKASRKGASVGFGKASLNISPGFIGGLVAGLTNYDNKIPADIRIAAAAAPVSGIGVVKSVAQGMILGDILQKRVGFRTTDSYRGAAFVGI